MAIYQLGDAAPQIHPNAYVHPEACVIGRVRIGPDASVWPGAVLRGDADEIVVGARTSIQDGAVLHVEAGLPTVIGEDCVIGHLAQVEGCRIGDGVLVGVSAVLLSGTQVGDGATIAAHALVPHGRDVPAGHVAVGVPATIRPGGGSREDHAANVQRYVAHANRYRSDLRRLDDPLDR